MKDWFIEFSNTPLGKIIAIGLFVIFCVIYIMSYTSVGKKALTELRTRATNVDIKVKKYKEELEEQYDKFKEEQDKKVVELKEENAELKEFICKTLKSINNKKVKEAIKKYEMEQLTTNNENNAQKG